ncbi:GntR family transcriptional regulator [Ornithinimicrobium pratense]|uniref:GntR family transcriptional regulator n=1 Tax=Ornithinimicrobium pratense TaxID=2593973 RepID=A0A5J6V2Q0_9MICO|nr:GntR family transcriptional regulator [Ornithinimicrobium pratense]QFG68190.1 GntR family transcriptional regulator [Ornithinimicrobium pratense]
MFDGREPIYVQIAESIRGEILSGALAEGEQVMSTTQYATTYRINPATAAKAFAELVNEGVLYKQRGVGMFVADGAAELLRTRGSDTFFSGRLSAVLAEAAHLGITPQQLITYITDHYPRKGTDR